MSDAAVPSRVAAATLSTRAQASEAVHGLTDALRGVLGDKDIALAAHVLSFPPTEALVAAATQSLGSAHPRVRSVVLVGSVVVGLFPSSLSPCLLPVSTSSLLFGLSCSCLTHQ